MCMPRGPDFPLPSNPPTQSYNFALVLLEIQDCIRQPPSAVATMKKVKPASPCLSVTPSFSWVRTES